MDEGDRVPLENRGFEMPSSRANNGVVPTPSPAEGPPPAAVVGPRLVSAPVAKLGRQVGGHTAANAAGNGVHALPGLTQGPSAGAPRLAAGDLARVSRLKPFDLRKCQNKLTGLRYRTWRPPKLHEKTHANLHAN